jgi:hypothetical protein
MECGNIEDTALTILMGTLGLRVDAHKKRRYNDSCPGL